MTLEQIIKEELKIIEKLDTTKITYGYQMGYFLAIKERQRIMYKLVLEDILNYIDYIEGKEKKYNV